MLSASLNNRRQSAAYMRSNAGFSLIEVMIGMAIIALTLALGTPSFSKWIRNTKIREAAESIQHGINLARTEAVRRNALVRFNITTGNNWQVGCVTEVVEVNGIGCPAVIQSRTSSSNTSTISYSEIPAAESLSGAFAGSVSFNGLGRSTLTAGTMAQINIQNDTCATVSTPNGTRCLRINISSGGQVRMCDPALPTPTATPLPSDAQACPSYALSE